MENDPLLTPPKIWNFPYVSSFLERYLYTLPQIKLHDLKMEVFFLTLKISVESFSNLATNNSFGIFMDWQIFRCNSISRFCIVRLSVRPSFHNHFLKLTTFVISLISNISKISHMSLIFLM